MTLARSTPDAVPDCGGNSEPTPLGAASSPEPEDPTS
jgi:hypothetical protein